MASRCESFLQASSFAHVCGDSCACNPDFQESGDRERARQGQMPDISIIIVNYNGIALLRGCLDSVLRQTYRDYEVILVDNGSGDGSGEFVASNYPGVMLISLEFNTGFTGGNLAGLAHARGEHVVLLNNDVVLPPEWLGLMRSAVTADEEVGYCSARIVIAGSNLLDSAGDFFTTAFSGTKVGELHSQDEFTNGRFVPGACAAAVIYRRVMLDDVGFLDEDFFLNHEDTDLNLRAWLAGWKCLYVPEAIAYHKVSTTIGKMSDVSVYYFARNSLWVWIKNVPASLMVRYLLHRLAYEVFSAVYFCLVAKKWRPFLRGKYDSIAGIPKMWRKRQAVQAKKRLSNREITSQLIPLHHYVAERLRLMRHAKNRVAGQDKRV